MKHFDDLTKIDVPFGELDRDTKKRLRRCETIEQKTEDEDCWYQVIITSYFDDTIYRKIKPTPMTRQQVLEKYNVLVTEDRKG